MKDYRYLGEDADLLGRRMDAARFAWKNTKSKWAKKYWRQVLNQLKLQWKFLPTLHDADAKMTIIPRWTVDYDYFERGHMNEGNGIVERLYDKFKLSVDLEDSWNRNREKRLAKAQ